MTRVVCRNQRTSAHSQRAHLHKMKQDDTQRGRMKKKEARAEGDAQSDLLL